MNAICPVILAGGQGTRLWPLSTPERPKQFLRLPGMPSLFQQAIQRVTGKHFLPPVIVCQKIHEHLITQELIESGTTPTAILLEDKPRNTAIAIALASTWINQHLPQDTQCLILPADQLLDPIEELQKAALKAVQAYPEHLNLFGLKPQEPSSQFGYIKTNINGTVVGFEEKPDQHRAIQLIEEHNAYWNSGCFLARNNQLQHWFKELQPAIFTKAHKSLLQASANNQTIIPGAAPLTNLPNLPFDKAIVEFGPSNSIPLHHTLLNCTWRDMGSWQAWHELALAQEPSTITKRRWGHHKVLTEQPGYKLKQLTLAAGASISYQKHQHRSEHWVIMEGVAEVRLENEIKHLEQNEEITIRPTQWHQLINLGANELTVIETQVGSYLEEDDIIRAEEDSS